VNLLINNDGDLKVCDMGLARFNNSHADSMDRLCGTYSYLAPEIFLGGIFTEKADIFSMGIIIWEIVVTMLKRKYELPYIEEHPELKMDFQIAVAVAEKVWNFVFHDIY
jgi:serine/threonine protein kinase